MADKTTAIVCTRCGADTFVRREPLFDGLRKTGEVLICVSCGHRYASEAEVPFKAGPRKPAIFNEGDKRKKVEIFQAGEGSRNCRHCRNYVVNPFIQRCGLHMREVQATDCCQDFEAKEKEKEKAKDTVT